MYIKAVENRAIFISTVQLRKRIYNNRTMIFGLGFREKSISIPYKQMGDTMKHLLTGVWLSTVVVWVGCDEEKPQNETQNEEQQPQEDEETSVYGSCSLDLVSASGTMFSALTIEASSVVVQLGFAHDEHGEQLEEHPLTVQEDNTTSISWGLDLEFATTPEQVVLGQSTLWNGSVFDPIDKVFVALDENDQICDCWAVSTEYGRLNCSAYETQ